LRGKVSTFSKPPVGGGVFTRGDGGLAFGVFSKSSLISTISSRWGGTCSTGGGGGLKSGGPGSS